MDTTNNRVGIGTASPTVPLYVTGNNATATVIMQDETNGAKLRLLANSINFDISNGGGGGDIAVSGANPLTFRTNGTERARIDSSGNVGIGVTPSAWRNTQRALQIGAVGTLFSNVASGGSTAIGRNVYESTAGDYTYIVNDEATFYEQSATGTHAWYTAAAGTGTIAFGSAKMTLDASGNLLVGKAANYGAGEINTLQLKASVIFGSDNTGSASNRNWSIGTNVSGAGNMEWTISSTNTGIPNFAYRMQITSAGDVNNTTGTYGTISDLRLKENVSDARNYLADLLKLRVVKYSLKEEASAVATKLGFIAQEVEQVFPNLVDQSDKEYEGAEGIRSVKTSILIPMLLKAIQELTARVQTLEAR